MIDQGWAIIRLADLRIAAPGRLDAVIAAGCPAIDTYAFDFGLFTVSGAPGARSLDAAMADYQTGRDDQVLVMYEFTT